jgi:hypothetical protein
MADFLPRTFDILYYNTQILIRTSLFHIYDGIWWRSLNLMKNLLGEHLISVESWTPAL